VSDIEERHNPPMPVSTKNSRAVYDAVKACGIRLISALPETWLIDLVRMADDDPEMTLVHVAREEESVGISMGAYFAGVRSAMVLQNHGLLASINAIVSGAQLYRIPLLMLVSYRGELGEQDPWQTEGGAVTEDALRALRIPFSSLDCPDHATRCIADAQALAYSANKPVAVLLRRALLWEDRADVAHDEAKSS
jgi:sulfopyruvate decarboxylase subunit alpha